MAGARTGKNVDEERSHYGASFYDVIIKDLIPMVDKTFRTYTDRKKCDGGAFEGDESERVKFFKKVLKETAGLAYVDFEEGFGDASLVAQAHAAGVKVVRSDTRDIWLAVSCW